MALAYYSYRYTRGWADGPAATAEAFATAREVIHIEQSLGIFVEHSVQAWVETKPLISDFAAMMYINAQAVITVSALAYLYVVHNKSFYFVRNMFAVAFAIALVGYVVLPTAPPRFFPEWGFVDTVAEVTGVKRDNSTVNALFNPYAAIPSMHVGFALMIGVPIARLGRHRVTRWVWGMYPLLVTFVIVVTANHFFIDAILGAMTAALGAWVAAFLGRVRPTAWNFRPPAKATA
jgi:membrane-associated phospholipid phosphatase